jgi:hypothetical protein
MSNHSPTFGRNPTMNQKEQNTVSIAWALTLRSSVAGKPCQPGMIRMAIDLARRLHSLDEKDCNTGLTERDEKREKRMEEQAQTLAAEMGATAFHQGDPRGATLYFVFPGDLPPGATIQSSYTNGVAIY